jgi:hypothetical protein
LWFLLLVTGWEVKAVSPERRWVVSLQTLAKLACPIPTTITYITLDALRGVAALAVVGLPRLLSSGLAVDLFFILSGFVVQHAYGNHLRREMTFSRFMLVRMIRLYPLYIIGLTVHEKLAEQRPRNRPGTEMSGRRKLNAASRVDGGLKVGSFDEKHCSEDNSRCQEISGVQPGKYRNASSTSYTRFLCGVS